MLKKITCMIVTVLMLLNVAIPNIYMAWGNDSIGVVASAAAEREEISVHDSRVTYDRFNKNDGSAWSNVIGASITLTFTGTSLEYYGTHDSTHGIAEIKIDGQFVTKLDTYGAWVGEEKLWSVGGLEDKSHTFVITVLNEKNPASSNYYLDCLKFVINASGGTPLPSSTPTPTPTSSTKEEIPANDSRVIVSSGWNREASGSIWGNTIGSTITLTFTGTGLEYYGTFDTTHGKAEIKIDGVIVDKFDGYGSSGGVVKLWSVYGLENKEHTFVFTVLNEKNPLSSNYYHDLIHFIAIKDGGGVPATPTPNVDEQVSPSDPRVTAPGWNKEASGSIWTLNPGMTVTFTFTGTGVEFYGTCNGDHGKAEIKIDGEVVDELDTYGPWQGVVKLWSVYGLENKEHTFVLTTLNKKNPASSGYAKDAIYFIVKAPAGDPPDYGDWPQPAEVVNVIYDSDMGADCDDAGSAAMLAAYAQSGKVNLLAMMCSIGNKYGAPCIDAINTYYGMPDIPIGTLKGMDNFHADDTLSFNKYIAESYPNDTYSGLSAPDAVALYRETLAKQPDKSVVVICTGSQLNLYNLLLSGPDEYSGLTGKELVEQKVALLSCMGGKFPSGLEWNIQQHPVSAKYVAENWNTPIMYAGYEIGAEFLPGTRRNEMAADDPVRCAYDRFTGSTYYGREGWDPAAVLYAIEGLGDYWDMKRGKVTIGANGQNSFAEDNSGNHAYLVKKMNPTQLCAVIDQLFVDAQKANLTDAYKLKFTDGSNQAVYKLGSNTNTLNATLTYRNSGTKEATYTAYVAVYDETGMLVKIGSSQKNLDPNQPYDFPIVLSLEPAADKSKYSVCVYIWGGSSLEPMHRVFKLQ